MCYKAIVLLLQVSAWLLFASMTGASASEVLERSLQESSSSEDRVLIKDVFGRVLNDDHIPLVDLQGPLANPTLRLFVHPPESNDVSYPLTVTLKAHGTSRLMINWDWGLLVDDDSVTKTVVFQNRNDVVKLDMSIRNDREGGYGEIEEYTLDISYQQGDIVQSIPIRVLDLDKDFEPELNMRFNYNVLPQTGMFERLPGYKEASELAVKDWCYYIQRENENFAPFTEFVVEMESVDGPYASGWPTAITATGIAAGARMRHHDNPNNDWVMTIDENDLWTFQWGQTGAYSLALHEFGHAIVYSNLFPNFADFASDRTESITRWMEYVGEPATYQGSGHIKAKDTWTKGHAASNFPWTGRTLKKSWYMVAEHVGYKLREIGPFLEPAIVTKEMVGGVVGKTYSWKIKANNGGAVHYDWTIDAGTLPPGLTLNRLTGVISGTPTKEGVYSFTVALQDFDPSADKTTKTYEIPINLDPNSVPESASVVIAADDEYVLWVNGEQIGSGRNWRRSQTYSEVSLQYGYNEILAKVTNANGNGYFAATVDLGGASVATDGSWEMSGDQVNWRSAPVLQNAGLAHQANWLSDGPVNAQFLWPSNGNRQGTLYFRRVIHVGRATVAADNKYDLYVNGNKVGSHNKWWFAKKHALAVGEGPNEFRIDVQNSGGYGYLSADIQIGGSNVETDSGWEVSHDGGQTWEPATEYEEKRIRRMPPHKETYPIIWDNQLWGAKDLSFRRTIYVGTVTAACDNAYTLSVNGDYVGSGTKFRRPDKHSICLVSGYNEIDVVGIDRGGYGRFVADVRVGNSMRFSTDSSWQVSVSNNDDDDDDPQWTGATALEAMGTSNSVWNLQNFPSDTEARWIWGGNTWWTDLVYLRRGIEIP